MLLQPLSTVDVPLPSNCSQLLISAIATIEGIKQAYQQLKALQTYAVEVAVGVVMLDREHSERRAAYFYSQLAVAARRFLQIDMVSFGCLASPPPVETKRIKAENEAIAHMTGIARLLIEDRQQLNNTGRFIPSKGRQQ